MSPQPSRLSARLVLAASVLLFLAVASPALVGHIYVGNDLGVQFIPFRRFFQACLAAGDSTFWIPSIFSGYFLLGEGQGSAFHPLHQLLYRALPFSAAFDVEILCWFPVAYAGTYVFLRRLALDRAASLAGALMFGLGTFNIHRLIHPNALAIIAHTPWLLVTADVLARGGSERAQRAASIATPLLVASEILLGYPQYVFFAALVVGAHVLFLWIGRETDLRRIVVLGVAYGVGGAMGAVQLLASSEALTESIRARGELWPRETAYIGSTAPQHLLELFSAFILPPSHKQRVYAGAVPVLLSIWALTQARDRRRTILAWAAFALLMIWLGTGQYGFLYRLQTYLPVIGKFRYPSRYFVLAHLAMAVLSAIALHDLATRRSEERSKLWPIWAAIAVSVGLTAWAFVSKGSAVRDTIPLKLALGGALFVLAGLAVVAAAKGRRGALHALVVLAALDQGVYGVSYSIAGKQMSLDDYLASTDVPPGGQPGERVAGGRSDRLAARGFRLLDGVVGLDPERLLDYRKVTALRVAGVRWIAPPTWEPGLEALLTYDMTKVVDDPRLLRHGDWREVPDPLPRVRLVASATVSRDPARDLEGIRVETTALVEAPVELDRGAPGSATFVEDRPGKLTIAVDAPGRRLLVVSESYSRGWRATVDGAEAKVLRVNGDFLGVPIAPTARQVRLTFEPRSLRLGLGISLAGVLAWVVLSAVALGVLGRRPGGAPGASRRGGDS